MEMKGKESHGEERRIAARRGSLKGKCKNGKDACAVENPLQGQSEESLMKGNYSGVRMTFEYIRREDRERR